MDAAVASGECGEEEPRGTSGEFWAGRSWRGLFEPEGEREGGSELRSGAMVCKSESTGLLHDKDP